MLEIRINRLGGADLDLVRKYVDLVGKYVEGVRYKSKSHTQIRFTSFWRKRGEPREERTCRVLQSPI